MPHLEITELELVQCGIVNDCQHDLIVLYIFVTNKSFNNLLKILPEKI